MCGAKRVDKDLSRCSLQESRNARDILRRSIIPLHSADLVVISLRGGQWLHVRNAWVVPHRASSASTVSRLGCYV